MKLALGYFPFISETG